MRLPRVVTLSHGSDLAPGWLGRQNGIALDVVSVCKMKRKSQCLPWCSVLSRKPSMNRTASVEDAAVFILELVECMSVGHSFVRGKLQRHFSRTHESIFSM